MPAGVEPDASGISPELERPHGATRRQKSQRRHHVNAEPRERRANGERGCSDWMS